MEEKFMRAAEYDSYGGGAGGLKVRVLPIPTPGKGEVLLKLEATTLNPMDWKIQKGMLRPFLPTKFPFIPATDVAGEVVKVGLGVANFKRGDKVIALLTSGSGLAEYAVAKTNLTVHRPFGISPVEGASLPVAGLAAHGALTQSVGLKLDGSEAHKNILITAASGGVGTFAIQLAKLGGAHVTATCGARNIDLVKSLGADEVLDYKTPEGAALTSPSGKKYDAVIHCASPIPWSVFEPNLSADGKVIDLSPGASAMWTFAVKKLTFSKKQLVIFSNTPKAENLLYLAELVEQGKLKVVIDSTFTLNELGVASAWRKGIDGHATGKIAIEP